MLAVSDLKAVERGQGNAVSAVEMAERLKEIGFQLMVRAGAIGLGCGCAGGLERVALRTAIICLLS